MVCLLRYLVVCIDVWAITWLSALGFLVIYWLRLWVVRLRLVLLLAVLICWFALLIVDLFGYFVVAY